MSYTLKQVIVVRKDLNMRKGKIAAQAAHASMKVFMDNASFDSNTHHLTLNNVTVEMMNWLKEKQPKICLYVESQDELVSLYSRAKELNIPCSLVVDEGYTEFKGVSTKTCIAIGPAKCDLIDEITGHLKLL